MKLTKLNYLEQLFGQSKEKKMNYIEELKKAVSKAFADCQDKKSVDAFVEINTAIDKVEGETAELMDKNKELIAAYKDAVTHPAITDKPTVADPTTIKVAKELDIRDFLNKEMTKKEGK